MHFLEIDLTTPEEEIVIQNQLLVDDEEKVRMFFVAKGAYDVVVVPHYKAQPVKVNYLTMGDHFGELALVFGCKRSATVLSVKYGCLGYITRKAFNLIKLRFPEVSLSHNPIVR